MTNFPTIKHISECFVKPKCAVEDSKQPYHLTQWDLALLSYPYSQNGLLYPNPKLEDNSIDKLLESLKDSLALTLVHFYPLAGQLVTNVDLDRNQSFIFLDCNKGPGARFIHATLDVTMSDIVSLDDVPSVVHSLFDLDHDEVGHDGHTLPNLSIQVTQLVDGVFISCSMNHVIADGTSYCHFWNMWSEIHRANGNSKSISRPPVYGRWYPDGYGPSDVFLPFVHPDEFISRPNRPDHQLKEKFFTFGLDAIHKLKSNANKEYITNHKMQISSFQALSAFIWRSIIRAKRSAPESVTHCKLAANNRSRVDPQLSPDYFGCSADLIVTSTTVGELLEASLGRIAGLLQQSVLNRTGEVVKDLAMKWFESPFLHKSGAEISTTTSSVFIGSSPRFDVYGNEFRGLGKPIAVRDGISKKYSGRVVAYPGRQGSGSVELEVCLSPDCMINLTSDDEFMAFASPSSYKL